MTPDGSTPATTPVDVESQPNTPATTPVESQTNTPATTPVETQTNIPATTPDGNQIPTVVFTTIQSMENSTVFLINTTSLTTNFFTATANKNTSILDSPATSRTNFILIVGAAGGGVAVIVVLSLIILAAVAVVHRRAHARKLKLQNSGRSGLTFDNELYTCGKNYLLMCYNMESSMLY